MNNKINMSNDYVLRKSQVVGKPDNNINKNKNVNVAEKSKNFQEILQKIENKDSVKFSKHATNRLESRNINLSSYEMTRIDEAINKADKKGVKEALILMDNKIFIASISNKTIITASVENELKENVFTNIDGAVII